MSGIKRTQSMADRGDYKVGYGKPPIRSRFKPGQSGNPNGRPTGTHNFKTDVKSTLTAPVKLTRDGKPHKVSTQAAMLLRLREKALSGDSRALDRLILLAQAYNDEELAAADRLSADDAHVLGIYQARSLSKLTPMSASAVDQAEPAADDRTSKSKPSIGRHKSKRTKIKRLRLTRARSDD
jgi:hypothetical protein